MITVKQVSDFKESFCNENTIISDILKDQFESLIDGLILDVGSGLGDISSFAFRDKELIHLDIKDYSHYKIPEKHSRVRGNFFEYKPESQIQTLLLFHVLQFIDDDIEKLHHKVKEINPENILIVRNTNNDFMGKLMEWFDSQNIQSNPERTLANFPVDYSEFKKALFTAELNCPSYEILAEQVSYLWDVKFLPEQNKSLQDFLKQELFSPQFEIHQMILLYKKVS